MSTSKPVFPDSLPPQRASSYMVSSPRNVAVPVSVASESGSVIKILIALLILAMFGNLALTLYLNRSHENIEISAGTAKDAKMIDELEHVRAELLLTRNQLIAGQADINRMKVQYATVIAQVGATVASPPMPYATPARGSEVSNVDIHGAPPRVEKAGGQPK